MLLLAMIYLAFVALGLPDSLLGAAWPLMYGPMEAPTPHMQCSQLIWRLA